jgi:hypothetical protein
MPGWGLVVASVVMLILPEVQFQPREDWGKSDRTTSDGAKCGARTRRPMGN